MSEANQPECNEGMAERSEALRQGNEVTAALTSVASRTDRAKRLRFVRSVASSKVSRRRALPLLAEARQGVGNPSYVCNED